MWIICKQHRQLPKWDTSWKQSLTEKQLRSCIYLRSKADFGKFRVSENAEKYWGVFYCRLTLSWYSKWVFAQNLWNIYYKNLKYEYSASTTGLKLLCHNHNLNWNNVLTSFRTYGIEYIRGAWACLLKK